jgi:hypothetical protein
MAGGGVVTFGVDGTIKLTNVITVAGDTTLDGSGHSVVISGGNAVRLFQVNTGVVFGVNELTLADGRFVGTTGRLSAPMILPQDGFGAGILNKGGIVSLTSCALTNHNVLGGSGDPRAFQTNQAGANGFGAALCNLGGRVSLTNCLLIDNSSQGGLGSPNNHVDTAGVSGHGWGGAIYSLGGNLNLSGVSFETNFALGGATQDSLTSSGAGGAGIGGAVYITNSGVYASGSMWIGNTRRRLYGG